MCDSFLKPRLSVVDKKNVLQSFSYLSGSFGFGKRLHSELEHHHAIQFGKPSMSIRAIYTIANSRYAQMVFDPSVPGR